MCSMHRLLNPQTCGSAAHGREHFPTLPILFSHVERWHPCLPTRTGRDVGALERNMMYYEGVDRSQQQQQTGVNFIMPEDKRAYDLFITAQMMKMDFANLLNCETDG